MNVESNILFAVHEGAPFVDLDVNDHNLLQKGAPSYNAISTVERSARLPMCGPDMHGWISFYWRTDGCFEPCVEHNNRIRASR
jgi:hypothetical protein